MSGKMYFLRILSVFLMALILSVVFVTPVFADGETPPQTEEIILPEPDSGEEVTSPPQENVDLAVTEPSVEQTAPLPDPQEGTVQEGEVLLDTIPADTELIVLDEAGDSLPLASQDAAEIVLEKDPMWCPAGVTPGAASCSKSYTNLKLLTDALMAGTLENAMSVVFTPAGSGVIWIEAGADTSAGGIILNGADSDLASIVNFALTLKGGWSGAGTTITSTPSSFSQSISIQNWIGDITLNDIVINGTGGDGLNIETDGAIVLTRVNSVNNAGSGAVLDNDAGTKNVSISSGQFNGNNGSYGLQIASSGVITLKNISAIGNLNGTGAQIDNTTAATPKAVTLSGVNTFTNNYWNGLNIYSLGAITVNDITASENGHGTSGTGAFLYNPYSGSTAGVTLTGTNIFNDNFYQGLEVYTNGAVKANNVIANSNNNGVGAYLSNAGSLTPQPITLTGTNEFKYNYYQGLYINSKGLVTLNNINASGSLLSNGLYVDTCNWNVSACTGSSSGGLKLTGTNFLNDNYSYGLYVYSNGSISINNITASNNGWGGSGYGAYLDNCVYSVSACTSTKSITFSGVNTFNGNLGYGLYVTSNGSISAANLTAIGNDNYGAYLVNSFLGSNGNIVLTGKNNFSENSSHGLYLQTEGTISVSNLTALGNGTSGSGYGAYLDNSLALTPKGVTLSGVNNLAGNRSTNLYIATIGAIKINSLTANNSQIGYGAYLSTTFNHSSTPAVALTGSNIFNNNALNGLYININGIITLNNITANGNLDNGISISNLGSGDLAPRNVTLTGVNIFNENANYGLIIDSYGTISVSNLTANDNNGYGAMISNSYGSLIRNVTLSGVNLFNGNNNTGLSISSLGSIKVNNLTASNNQGNGATLTNNYVGYVSGISLSGTNTFMDNWYSGLVVTSNGAIAVNNLRVEDNGSSGFYNGASLTSNLGTVTLTGINFSNNNTYSGLEIYGFGEIKLSNLSASQNGYDGVNIDNSTGSSTAGVTLTGISNFNNNYRHGLLVDSYGAINILTTSLTANENGSSGTGYGVVLSNYQAASPKNVKITGTNILNENQDGGISINSIGAITASNLSANNTVNGNGASIYNNWLGAVGNITLSGTNTFNSNYNNGLNLASIGTITVNNLTANWNGITSFAGSGVILNNNGSSSPQAVKLTGTNTFNDNYSGGLTVYSLGTITANNLSASHTVNGSGASLYNDYLGAVGGVSLTGKNYFSENSNDGLAIQTYGNVSLTKVIADGNNDIGTYVSTTGNITLTCGSFTNNTTFGMDLNTSLTLTLIGVFSSGNPSGNSAASTVTVRNCPLP